MNDLSTLQEELQHLASGYDAVKQIQQFQPSKTFHVASNPGSGFEFTASGYTPDELKALFESVDGRLTAHQDQAYLVRREEIKNNTEVRTIESTVDQKTLMGLATKGLLVIAFGLFLAFINVNAERNAKLQQLQQGQQVQSVKSTSTRGN